MHICRMTVCQHRTQQNWTHVCILHSDFLFLHLIALLLYSQTGALLGAAVQKRKGGKKKKKTLAKVCYLCPVPHGGVLQNRWMEALERLWSSTSGWPRIRQPPPPSPHLLPPFHPPSVPLLLLLPQSPAESFSTDSFQFETLQQVRRISFDLSDISVWPCTSIIDLLL